MPMKDEWAFVLDFLAKGHVSQRREEPVAQLLGERYFSLLEIAVREGVNLLLEDKVYIGEGKRDQVKFIKRTLSVKDLTATARNELDLLVEKIVIQDEKRFVEFFNKAGPLTTRMHQLEVLPGVGKKHLWSILEARKEKPFESYDDIKKRLPLLISPVKMVKNRIIEEMESDDERYYLFVLSKVKRDVF